MRYVAVGTLAATFALSACTTTTEDLHNSAQDKGTLAVATPYQEVYTEITTAVAKCFPNRGSFSAHTYSRSTQFVPGRIARIEGLFGTGLGQKVMLSIDVMAAMPTGTAIDYYSNYYGLLSKTSLKPLLQKWISGDYDCDYTEFP